VINQDCQMSGENESSWSRVQLDVLGPVVMHFAWISCFDSNVLMSLCARVQHSIAIQKYGD
jgi:hypothetical protein